MTSFRTIIVSLAILLVVAQPAAVSAQDLVAQQRVASALEAGRYDEALQILSTLVEPGTRDTRLLLLRARAHEGRGNAAQARADFQAVLTIDPANQEALQGMGRLAAGQPQGTGGGNLVSLRSLIESNPDNLAFRIRYADALYDAQRFREAAQAYGEYLQRTQATPDIIQRYLISIAGYEGDSALGERVAQRYTSIYRTDDDLWMRLGYFRLWQGNRAGALEACAQALRLNPNNRDAKTCETQARSGAAAAGPSNYPIDVLFREVREKPADDAARFRLVDLLIDARRYFEARQQLDLLAPRHRASDEWTGRFETVRRGLAASPSPNTGNTPAVRTEFIVDRLQRELRATPNDDEKRFRLVEELNKFGRHQEAYDQLLILLERHGSTQRWLAQFVTADNGLVATSGTSPIFAIDRYTYRLRFDPRDMSTRLSLVDALADANRVTEALETLTDPVHSNPADPGYQARLSALSSRRTAMATARVAELERSLSSRPDDGQALRDLAESYMILGRSDDAFAVYAALLRLEPTNDEQRARYADALRVNGYREEALRQATLLVDRQPDHPGFQRLYVLSAISGGRMDDRAERYAARLVSTEDQNDPQLLLDLADFRLAQGDPDGAEALLRRADASTDTRYAGRIDALAQLVERERIRRLDQARFERLNEARRLAAARKYDESIRAYEAYFETQGRRSRAEMKELAQVHTAKGDFVGALSVLQALQEQAWDYDVAKEIARNQIYRKDYSGALVSLQDLIERNPNDYEARFMQADAYRELGLYAQAEQIYADAYRLAGTSQTVGERSVTLDLSMRAGLGQTAEGRGYDFVGILVPTVDAVIAHGGGTNYNRWMQGAQAHVTLPIGWGSVLMAGVNSYFLSGTRQLIPNSPSARGRVNQVFAAGFVDLAPKAPEFNHASFISRISVEGGLYDYEGGRTVGFGGIRYWRQDPGVYRGSIGLRAGEGSIDLWSPAGGEYNLRNTQLDIQGWAPNVMPDSTLRLAGYLGMNLVRDNFGTIATSSTANYGSSLRLEGSYKIVPRVWFGVMWHKIAWRTTTDLYWSPRDYQSWDIFLEYEKNMPREWYLRLRGAMGIIAQSNGFVSRRLELDLIKRLSNHFSLNVVGAVGQSSRSMGSGASSFIDDYNSFSMTATLYWTL